ncbi:aminoglycoside phosphotransferase [Salipiger sp. CCB-MM3]|uniref:aminoglycoside phosphotransferase family protein n=1 Tax=Salipiger sp. CCB-MM3 TaxID=1792508 RepID=UPI00080A9AE8|nr:phosphotransferase [Salipiger sp. CCB-MM3]ANT60212.1 aminoglycoside phosphotransferase [Salipiger sp. CCB-MM3]
MRDFLRAAGWEAAAAQPLAGDASTRRYTRLSMGGQTAILMQDPDGDVALFARLARHLTSLGLSAPQVLAEAPGLLLLEDLGDGLIARLATDPQSEKRLYLCATDALIALHRHAAPADLPVADAAHLSGITDLAFDVYAARAGAPVDAAVRDAAIACLRALIETHAPETEVMILRDYHAENILWLPDRDGAARAGLLDFQDALQGHRAYDLISLIEDARRDVSEDTAHACIRHYIAETGTPEAPFRTALALLGAQRNLRILGVFARLAQVRRKPHYIDLIPRVWAHLQTDLAHPALTELRARLAPLPAPTPAILERLKS